MTRFYVPRSNVKKNEIIITGKEAHHAIDVMRLRDKDKVVVFDGTGNEYTGFIKKTDKRSKKVTVEIVRTERPQAEHFPDITLAQAIPKKNKMDYIIEKATELGVARVVPLVSKRTIVRPDKGACEKKVNRWKKIALEASKQCGRRNVPVIDEVTEYKKTVQEINQYDLVLVACLSGKTIFIKDALSGFKTGKVLVFIGPEGDFTREEIQMANRDNCKFVSLGKLVLKSDTAALFVLSALGCNFPF